ncbi:MAG TPA: hypothetical protein VKB76_21170 [Ktedonobacterales bacterium]|nr:hypothetical protein [Ktedonobacterales bacterium]
MRIVHDPYQLPGELPFTVDHFDIAGNLINTLGRYPDLASGRQAFDDAVSHRPQRIIYLRRRTRVIASHEPRK